jgi:hypothetical protein
MPEPSESMFQVTPDQVNEAPLDPVYGVQVWAATLAVMNCTHKAAVRKQIA